MPIVIRALGKLGDAKLVDTLLPLVSRPEREVRIEAIQAVAKIADERHADQLRAELQAQVASPDQTIARMAAAAITELENRLAGGLPPAAVAGTVAAATGPGAVRPPQPAPPEPTKTLVTSEATLGQAASKAEAAARLDIQTLKSGDIIEGRYKYIDRIGRGAFGTVLLMEDTVVDERLILKFLNPNVSQDEEVMKRFVHELRYSRKITHKNVIRIYDFLYIQGLYAISMEYFPSHTLGSHPRQRGRERQADRAATRLAVWHRHVHRHDGRAPGRHRAPRSEARQRAHQPGGAPQDRRLRCRRRAA